MADARSRVDKLRAMAKQRTSPAEAEIARARLLAMGESLEEPMVRITEDPLPVIVQPFSWSTPSSSTTNIHVGNIHLGVRVRARVPSPFGEG